MHSFKSLLLILFVGVQICQAQDTTVLLSPLMFDKDIEQIYLSTMDGWLFKEGNDSSWAKKNIDLTGWKKLKPTGLSGKYADKNGKVECWFRIKIKLDTAFRNKPIGFRIGTWAATDLYIDGNLIGSFGNTGKDGTPFREFNPFNKAPVPVNLMPGNEYRIALHFVDYLSPFPPRRLKSQDGGLEPLIRITGPGYSSGVIRQTNAASNFSSSITAVCGVLGLLFWLLSFLNPIEKDLKKFALCSTLYAAVLFFLHMQNSNVNLASYAGSEFYNYAGNISFAFLVTMVPYTVASVFKRRVTIAMRSFLIIILLYFILSLFLPLTKFVSSISVISVLGVIVAICVRYLHSSWKTLKGAQWAVVAGLLVSMLSGILLFISFALAYYSYVNLLIAGFALSFPLSLLVYVAIRFKEIIKEIELHAKRVVQLSEEKKEQALNQQKVLQEEVDRQTTEIRNTLDNLRSTQAQLIQSEKMASLGELTAGIAHEIQNPLNFVNNFSEVSNELLDEMKTELTKDNKDDAIAIANDIKQNLEKILHHGKRADGIVKGMLQHSRNSSGVKEPTDINALADEYLRLAYHGLRAKDKSFNATMKTDFDNSVGTINIIPEEIGRVILNLINNAFYAVDEKKRGTSIGSVQNRYEPTVSVSTKKTNGKVEIKVSDNGNGIRQKVLDKIFQPFFTTRPTGQGTGLGLSLAYDIIKAHGGEIIVETKEGNGSEFVIKLPIV